MTHDTFKLQYLNKSIVNEKNILFKSWKKKVLKLVMTLTMCKNFKLSAY